jgi:hypothetical protein
LIEERLKQVVVSPIQQCDANGLSPERPSSIQAAETAADNHYMFALIRHAIPQTSTITPQAGTRFAQLWCMTIGNHIARWGGMRMSRRLRRSLPWIGTAIALATVAATMRRKGVISGVLDTGLNAMPFVGAAKNVVEVARGRDFFPDKYPVSGRR